MIGQTHGGKGGTRRKTNAEKYGKNHENIYGKKERVPYKAPTEAGSIKHTKEPNEAHSDTKEAASSKVSKVAHFIKWGTDLYIKIKRAGL